MPAHTQLPSCHLDPFGIHNMGSNSTWQVFKLKVDIKWSNAGECTSVDTTGLLQISGLLDLNAAVTYSDCSGNTKLG